MNRVDGDKQECPLEESSSLPEENAGRSVRCVSKTLGFEETFFRWRSSDEAKEVS